MAGWGTRLEGICGLGVQRWVWVVASGGGKDKVCKDKFNSFAKVRKGRHNNIFLLLNYFYVQLVDYSILLKARD